MKHILNKKAAVEFKLGASNLHQTSQAIKSIIESKDDLLLAAYGYAHAGTLNAMHLGKWLKSDSMRRLIILVGVHDTDINEKPRFTRLTKNFNTLFSHWQQNSVPLERIRIYAVQCWHAKILASMQSIGSQPKEDFDGADPADFEKTFSYDPTYAIAGTVREAVIGSSNATHRGMGVSNLSWNTIRNFELDIHVLRGSTLELGELSSKIDSILRHAITLSNTEGSHSQIATCKLRKLLHSAASANPIYTNSPYKLHGI